MKSHEKYSSKEETGTSKLSDSREDGDDMSAREKSKNRKSDKLSMGKQKSKYSNEKQFSITQLSTGLSVRSFSRRHTQDGNAYCKTEHETQEEFLIKKNKKTKCCADNSSNSEDNVKVSTSNSNPEILPKLCAKTSENAPRHRKCYTNSKHVELSKSLKEFNSQIKEVKKQQSINNLRNNNNATDHDERKIAFVVESTNKNIEKEEDSALLKRKPFSKVISKSFKQSKNEASCFELKKDNPQHTELEEDINEKENEYRPDIDQTAYYSYFSYKENENKMNFERSNFTGVKILLRGDLLGAFNCLFPQLNLEPSESNPRIPILDPSFSYFSDSPEILEETFTLAKKKYVDNRNRMKDIVKNFSKDKYQLLSLIETHTANLLSPTPSIKNLTKKTEKTEIICTVSPEENEKQNLYHLTNNNNKEPQKPIKLKQVSSATELKSQKNELPTEFISSNVPKTHGEYQKCESVSLSKSEPKISNPSLSSCQQLNTVFNFKTSLNASLNSFMEDHKQATSTPVSKSFKDSSNECLHQEYINYKNNILKHIYPQRHNDFRDIENIIHQLEDVTDTALSAVDTVTSESAAEFGTKKCLYSAVLKNSLSTLKNRRKIKELHQEEECHNERNTHLEVQPKYEIPFKYQEINSPQQHFKTNQTQNDETTKKTNGETVGEKKEILYNLEELEADITRNLEKLIEDPDNTEVLKLDLPPHNMFNYNQSINQSRILRNDGQCRYPVNYQPHTITTYQKSSNMEASEIDKFNMLAMNAQLTAQLQNNVAQNINNIIIPDNKPAGVEIPTNSVYYPYTSEITLQRHIKELLTRHPQLLQNNNVHQNTYVAAQNLASIYAQDASIKPQANAYQAALSRNAAAAASRNAADENLVLNQFIASQKLETAYNRNINRKYPIAQNLVQNKIPLMEYSKQLSSIDGQHQFEQDVQSSGIRTIISVSDLEKQALEQYRNSEESINARFEALEKEAEEQYN